METEFAPPDVDDYVVRLVQGAAQGNIELASHYWDFDAEKWVPHPRVPIGEVKPGRRIARHVWLDAAVDLTKDLATGIPEPDARQVLSDVIEEAKAATRRPRQTG